MKVYAGIGSRRRTPQHIFNLMTNMSSKLEVMGYVLRSGGAQGADKAFEAGVKYPVHKEIYRPKHATHESILMASRYHPFWENCDEITRQLHGRNSMIILGRNLKIPVKFVICYTPDGKPSGGTGVGIKMAEDHGIPVFNLFFPENKERVEKFLNVNQKIDMF